MTRMRIWTIAFGALLAIVSFAPRAHNLSSAYMIDEGLWLDRSERFIEAVSAFDPGAAFTTGHPGVTTMWIAGIAQKTLPSDAPLQDRYARARLAMALAATALLLALWFLARPLLGEAASAAGALLVAFDPYLLALTRVVHLDGLHALTALISLVCLLRARRGDPRMLGVSAAFCGAALLTRTLTTVPLILAAAWFLRRRFWLWSAIAAGVFIVAWPLVWVRPWKAIWLLGWGAARAAGAESDAGRFFLGRNVNPGVLYYPVVFALRSSIAALPASIAAGVWAFRRRKADPRAATAAALLATGIGAVLLMTVAGKKADRYVLPTLLAADVAIAIAAVRWLKGKALVPIMIVTLTIHAGPALAIHPFELAHFNWAAGGPKVARRAITIGRGEGLETAARAMNARAPGKVVATSRERQFEEFYNGTTVRLDDPAAGTADFVLFYISSIQTNRFPDTYARYRNRPPFYTLRINQMDYVQIWQR